MNIWERDTCWLGLFEDNHQKGGLTQEAAKLMHSGFCQILLLGINHVDPLEGIRTQILVGPPNTQESSLSPRHRDAHAAELPLSGLALLGER